MTCTEHGYWPEQKSCPLCSGADVPESETLLAKYFCVPIPRTGTNIVSIARIGTTIVPIRDLEIIDASSIDYGRTLREAP